MLLALVGKGKARQPAYELVQRHALAAIGGGPGFRERLAADPEIGALLSAEEIGRCFDLDHHLRFAGNIVDRALADRSE